mmetsp:Transcript_103182/g.166354  ORF Transcript_103182/g.166354 Transcript_103182/m.166354 type:complete len:280 (+) Transcript_103182:55-894(+)
MADPAAEEPAVQLEFQNFGSSGEGGVAVDGRIGKGAAPAPASFTAPAAAPSSDNFSFSDTAKLMGGMAGGGAATGSWNPFSLTTYQQYFDVDTADVVDRLRRSLSLKNEMFFEGEMKPDMYGPFWLCTTLVFVMAAAGNLGSLLSFVPSEEDQVFAYDFSKLTVATSVLYGYCVVVPVSGWAASKVMLATPFSLTELICIYGYSLAVYIPAALLCVLPMEILRWAIIAAGFVVSLKFITRNVRDLVIRQLDEAKALMILVVVTALHGFLALFLKVYFYS